LAFKIDEENPWLIFVKNEFCIGVIDIFVQNFDEGVVFPD